MHIYEENEPAVKGNKAVLKELFSEHYTIEANGKIPDNCKYLLALIHAAQNQKKTNTGGLAKLLKLKIDAKVMKVMSSVNIDIDTRPSNQ